MNIKTRTLAMTTSLSLVAALSSPAIAIAADNDADNSVSNDYAEFFIETTGGIFDSTPSAFWSDSNGNVAEEMENNTGIGQGVSNSFWNEQSGIITQSNEITPEDIWHNIPEGKMNSYDIFISTLEGMYGKDNSIVKLLKRYVANQENENVGDNAIPDIKYDPYDVFNKIVHDVNLDSEDSR